MRVLHLIPAGINLAFIPKHTMFFGFSALLIVASIGIFLAKGLNYGIDFQGGIMIEVRTENAANIGVMRGHLSSLGLGEVALQEFGAPTDVLIRVQRQEGGLRAPCRLHLQRASVPPGVPTPTWLGPAAPASSAACSRARALR